MIYTDTRDSSVKVDFKTAVMGGMNAQTGGLYMPVEFPELNKSFLGKIPEPSFRDIALNLQNLLLKVKFQMQTYRQLLPMHILSMLRLFLLIRFLMFWNFSMDQHVLSKILVHVLWLALWAILTKILMNHYIFLLQLPVIQEVL